MAKNKDVINAPSDTDILKEMQKSAPIIEQGNMKDIENLLSGYQEQLIVDAPAAEEFVKSKRGRKKGQKNGMKADDIFSDPDQSQQVNDNPIITGALLVMLIDIALPNIIVLINNKVSKSKIKVNTLQLTDDEKKSIEPLAEQVAKEMSVKANPLTVLIISLVGMYGMKLMVQKTE
jgi:hypothetical protein